MGWDKDPIPRSIRVSDECWIALALLHREAPQRTSFSAREILNRIRAERVHPEPRPGLQPHIYQHNVANVPPSSARYRLFYRLEDGAFRLFRPGDDYHPQRRGKTHPVRHDLPLRYQELVDWYQREYCAGPASEDERDPILQMRGVGKEIWEGIDSDAFIRELRAGWPSLESTLAERLRAQKPAAATPDKRSHSAPARRR